MIRRLAVMGTLFCASAAWAGFEVSSFHKDSNRGPNYFNAAAALDSNLETAWMVNPEVRQEGSWIHVDTPTSTIDKLSVVAGWAVDEERYQDYARIKAARVEIFTTTPGSDPTLVAETTVQFEDKMGWQTVDLPDTKVGGEFGGGRVKVTITELYKGADFPAAAMSEVRVHLKEFDAGTVGLRSAPDSEVAGHDGTKLFDGSTRSFWAAEGPTASFGVHAPGYGMSSIGIVPGPSAYARPKTVKLTANMAEVTHTLPDAPGRMQWLLLPALIGYTGGAWGEVRVEILDVYPGSQPGVAIAEIKMKAGSIEEF